MLRRVSLILGLTALVIILLGSDVLPGDEIRADDESMPWLAAYWNNHRMSGSPVLQRQEATLDHDWERGSPHSLIPSDRFSARWTRHVHLAQGIYEFEATSDDGIRVWVDHRLLIDQWNDHPITTYSADISLSGGEHLIRVEYYENRGLAVARVSWRDKAAPTQVWRGEYFNNRTLSGLPSLVRDDPAIQFFWDHESPAPGQIQADDFSVRWTRRLDPPAGNYRFYLTTDDGARLWIDQRLLIDAWIDQPATTYTGDIYLPGGPVALQVEYYDHGGGAVAQLAWSRESGPPLQTWQGEYYTNHYLSGLPVLVRRDPAIDFLWENDSPSPGIIEANRFSVRWSQTLDLPAGLYSFLMRVDDGGRLYVNDLLLIDAWQDQPATTYSRDIYLPGGPADIRMEYYDNVGDAVAELSWTWSERVVAENWLGEYYDNAFLMGPPLLVRDDAAIDFDWGYGSPAPGIISSDRFSAQWTRVLDLPAGTYRFTMRLDDRGQLYVSNFLLVDATDSLRTYTADYQHPGGVMEVKVTYRKRGGPGMAKLSWEPLAP